MKKIEAIVRKTKFEEVKESLHENGIEFFSFWEARGVGMARESRVYRGIAYDTGTIERLYLQIVVRDVNLEKTVGAISVHGLNGALGTILVGLFSTDNGLRVSKRIEEEGLYIYEHGESAYN